METLETGFYVGEERVGFGGGKVGIEFVTKVIGDGHIVGAEGGFDDLLSNHVLTWQYLGPPVSTERGTLFVCLWRISDVGEHKFPS
jgi:hypothetical protein